MGLEETGLLVGDRRVARRARRLHRRLAATIGPVVASDDVVDLAAVVQDLDGRPVDGLIVVTPTTVVVAHRQRRHHVETVLVPRSSITAVSVSTGADGRSTAIELVTAGGIRRLSLAGGSHALDGRLAEVLGPLSG
ncbi:hypothetical protein ACFFOS_02255 [Nocardioides kongjuensis]|uniref:Uncharacterized protein n=1 Tax=Nocardioides kongjuensis TaxID=349522 RepID=A0A852RCU0_9ACTN|nr:hypothetical protein [Nocardioides kongjuensis]NYD28598.1 hypothetical protein [Nocardioides kongjuensis]